MKKYILALDQGTTSSRAALFDKGGALVDIAAFPFRQIYPKPGLVEHDPADIFNSQMQAVGGLIEKTGIRLDEIASIGITNQRETTVVFEKGTGRPVHNAIVWQCRRTAHMMERLKNDAETDKLIQRVTGLTADAYFSASKIAWILDNVDGARRRAEDGELLFGTVDTYLLYRLTGGKVHATDYTNASRTLLYDIHDLKFDDGLLKLFKVPKCMLPEVHPSGHLYGYTDKRVFGAEIPITALVGDQQAALFGQGCVKKGDIKNTYGTGCFLLMNTGDTAVTSKRGLVTSLAAGLSSRPEYVLEGSVFVGGAVVQWLRDELGLIKTSAESESLAQSVEDCGGVTLVPAFTGLGAPHWDSAARGIITGITRGTNKAHIVRAGLESIAYQVFDVLHAMERDLELDVTSLRADGGASQNEFLMQFQADILNAEVICPKVFETTALGAALLSGLCAGFYTEKTIAAASGADKVFKPTLPESVRRERLLGWSEAVARCKAR